MVTHLRRTLGSGPERGSEATVLTLEAALRAFEASTAIVPERKRQLLGVRFYLRELRSLDPNHDLTLVSESYRRRDRAGLPPICLVMGLSVGSASARLTESPVVHSYSYVDTEGHRATDYHVLCAKRDQLPAVDARRVASAAPSDAQPHRGGRR